jgi:hypothetical protein
VWKKHKWYSILLVGLALLAIFILITSSCPGVTEKPLKEIPWTGEGPPPPPEPGTKWVIPKEEPSPSQTLTPSPASTPKPDITPPVISGVNVSHITESSATIAWETDEPSACQIEYGEDDTCDNVQDLGSTFEISHNIILTGLEAETNHRFRIRALDESGNEVVSKDYDFTTKTTEELLSSILYSGITIGDCVHQLSFSLFNGSSQTITVTKVEIFDERGDVAFTMSKSDIEDTWGSGEVHADQSVSASISFGIPPTTTEVEDWHVKWYCLDSDGQKFTVEGSARKL